MSRSSLLKRNLTKRQRFTLLTFLATIGLVATQLVARVELQLPLAVALAVLSAISSSYLGFRGELQGARWFTSVILIFFYTLAVALSYFLLPVRWLTRLPTAVLFGVGYYAIMLTENIYNVATGRSIQLLRAARSVGLLMTIMTVFLLFGTIISLRLSFWFTAVLLFIIAFPLALQSLMSMELDLRCKRKTCLNALLLAICVGEVGLALSFWPANGTLQALFLTAFFYLGVGMSQQALIDRLFAQTVREFIGVAAVVFILMLLATSWG